MPGFITELAPSKQKLCLDWLVLCVYCTVFNFYLLIIITEKPLWGDVNKVLYCIVLYCLLDHA